MKSFIDKVREDIKNGTNHAAEDLIDQVAPTTPLPGGTRGGIFNDPTPQANSTMSALA